MRGHCDDLTCTFIGTTKGIDITKIVGTTNIKDHRHYRRESNMFVRFKKLKRIGGGNLLAAYLVESKRIDGKPRQRIIAYLGSIRLLYAKAYVRYRKEVVDPVARAKRDEFWRTVEAKLNSLDIPMDARIIAQIEDKVQRDKSSVGTTKGNSE